MRDRSDHRRDGIPFWRGKPRVNFGRILAGIRVPPPKPKPTAPTDKPDDTPPKQRDMIPESGRRE